MITVTSIVHLNTMPILIFITFPASSIVVFLVTILTGDYHIIKDRMVMIATGIDNTNCDITCSFHDLIRLDQYNPPYQIILSSSAYFL